MSVRIVFVIVAQEPRRVVKQNINFARRRDTSGINNNSRLMAGGAFGAGSIRKRKMRYPAGKYHVQCAVPEKKIRKKDNKRKTKNDERRRRNDVQKKTARKSNLALAERAGLTQAPGVDR